MSVFYEEIKEIFRLCVPFEKIYTSVFFMRTEEGNILVDCATTAEDVDTVILPALRALGYELSDLRAIVLTHRHGDHAGGLARICALAPDLSVLTEVGTRIGEIELYPMMGHTLDSVGIYDFNFPTPLTIVGAGVEINYINLPFTSVDFSRKKNGIHIFIDYHNKPSKIFLTSTPLRLA